MSEPKHEELRRLFDLVIAAPAAQRGAVLDRECQGDADLRRRLEIMVAAAEDEAFLSEPTLADSASVGATLPAFGRERVGEQIGRYKLLEQIGEGGFGTVWAAEQREPVKRRVALKIIKLGMDTKQVIARFEAERQALAMMDHPNIAKVLDAGSTETGRPYFVMELVKGVPILEYCDREKLDTKARLNLFMDVCHAIQHAHQKGIIHRDIKPSNVLITLHDGKPVPKVIDFGIAKATNAELTEKTIYTQHRQMIGTPAYMSPEQAEMSGLDIDTRSDIYSLGVLLYELLTGTTPFSSDELMSKGFAEMMRIIRETEPHKPSTRLSTLGVTATRTAEQRRADVKRLGVLLRGDLDWIVMKCLEKDRVRRYETANGLAADIQRHLSDEPVTAGPPSASYKLRKLVKRNKGAFSAAAVIFIVLILGIAGTTWGLIAAKAQATRAERELSRATEIKRLIKDMLTSVKPEEARGQDTTLLKKILDDASQRLDKGEIKDDLIAAELHGIVGNVYRALGFFSEAEDHLPIALEITRRLLGEENFATLTDMSDLAFLYSSQGRFGEAEPLMKRALAVREQLQGADHPDTFKTMNHLGLLYAYMGRYDQAEPLLRKSLEGERRVRGEDHEDTLRFMNNLGVMYINAGRYADAEPLFESAIEGNRRVLGEDHPETIGARGNLALVYQSEGRLAEAETLTDEILNSQKRVLGAEHPDTLTTMHNLANLYQYERRNDEAESLYLQVLDSRKRVLGAEHPAALSTTTNLGMLYNRMERYEDAAAQFETCLPIMRRVLGVQNPTTMDAMEGLAAAYEHLGRRDDALPLQREFLGLKIAAADRPDAPPQLLNSLAWTLLTNDNEDLRDAAKALGYAQRACKMLEAAGDSHLPTCLDTLALAQHKTGDTAGAIETEQRAISLVVKQGADVNAVTELKKHLNDFRAALAGSEGENGSDSSQTPPGGDGN